MSAALAFEKPEAASLISAHSAELQHALAQAGVSLASSNLSVSTVDANASGGQSALFQGGDGGAASDRGRQAQNAGRAFGAASNAADQADQTSPALKVSALAASTSGFRERHDRHDLLNRHLVHQRDQHRRRTGQSFDQLHRLPDAPDHTAEKSGPDLADGHQHLHPTAGVDDGRSATAADQRAFAADGHQQHGIRLKQRQPDWPGRHRDQLKRHARQRVGQLDLLFALPGRLGHGPPSPTRPARSSGREISPVSARAPTASLGTGRTRLETNWPTAASTLWRWPPRTPAAPPSLRPYRSAGRRPPSRLSAASRTSPSTALRCPSPR